MSLPWIDKSVLIASTANVVRRADYEQVTAAQDLLAAARESAAALHGQLEALRLEAVNEGYAAGLERGKDAWAQQLAERHAKGQAQLRDLQPALVEVVMGSLRHLLDELPVDLRFERLAQRVVASSVRARQLRLIVCPADADGARALLGTWQQEHPHVAAVDIVVDDALSVGDCVLETEEGAIDGRLHQRLAVIEAALAHQLAAPMSRGPQPCAEVA